MRRASLPMSKIDERTKSVVRVLAVAYEDDAAFVRALADGHPPAAAAAWDKFAPLVRGLLWKAIGPGSDIDDLLQDVFLTLFKRVRDLRDPSALTSFVVGITIRTARSELRRRRLRRWLLLSDDGELPEVAAAASDHAGRQALRSFYAILDKLDPEARLVFVLRHTDGLELTEMAISLGCSLATVKRRLAKATERVLVHVRRDPVLLAFLGPENIARYESNHGAES